MRRILPLFILLVFLLPLLSAQTSQPPWNWSSYTGVSHWQVAVKEDDTGCGQGVNTEQFSISIQHNSATAVMGDVGHGPATGTFISPNILHIPARTVSDPPGTSKISDYDIFFTTDCSAFAARYTWDYSDQYGSCSGSTSLSGSNSQGCPVNIMAQLLDAKKDLFNYLDLDHQIYELYLWNRFTTADTSAQMKQLQDELDNLETTVVAKYQAILKKDPNYFPANWDMAVLASIKASNPYLYEKDPSNYDYYSLLYYTYMDRAMSSLTEAEKKSIEEATGQKLGFSTLPTKENSAVLGEESSEKDNWQGSIYGQDFQKEYSDKSTRNIKLFATLGSHTDVLDSVGVT
jgi:hypothetical protein